VCRASRHSPSESLDAARRLPSKTRDRPPCSLRGSSPLVFPICARTAVLCSRAPARTSSLLPIFTVRTFEYSAQCRTIRTQRSLPRRGEGQGGGSFMNAAIRSSADSISASTSWFQKRSTLKREPAKYCVRVWSRATRSAC